MRINGFIVARLPDHNILKPDDIVRRVNGVYYGGLDRQRWIDVFDEDYYAKALPAEIVQMAQALRAANDDFTGIELCSDQTIAWKLLEYSNRRSHSNELLAIRSESLASIKGTVETDLHVNWLGFDFVASGEWSLIADGLFIFPDDYSGWITRLNSNGLFDDASLLGPYIAAYDASVEKGHSEPIAPPNSGLEKVAIEVGRVLTQG